MEASTLKKMCVEEGLGPFPPPPGPHPRGEHTGRGGPKKGGGGGRGGGGFEARRGGDDLALFHIFG